MASECLENDINGNSRSNGIAEDDGDECVPKKRSNNWSLEQSTELIRLYTNAEWQKKFCSDKRAHKRVWKDLSQALKLRKHTTWVEAKYRWNNLKAFYNKKKRLVLEENGEKPNWEFWDLLDNFFYPQTLDEPRDKTQFQEFSEEEFKMNIDNVEKTWPDDDSTLHSFLSNQNSNKEDATDSNSPTSPSRIFLKRKPVSSEQNDNLDIKKLLTEMLKRDEEDRTLTRNLHSSFTGFLDTMQEFLRTMTNYIQSHDKLLPTNQPQNLPQATQAPTMGFFYPVPHPSFLNMTSSTSGLTEPLNKP